MIFVCGDTHIPIDIAKLNKNNFPEQMFLSKKDYVIVLGDFGGVWNNSKDELYWREWSEKRNFTTLFIDGNHENFNMLNKFPVKKWNGGKVHVINDSVIHLMRGQIFNIDGKKIFTMGGAESIDKYRRIEGLTWWKEELPSHSEYEKAIDNLNKENWKVDFVLTHDCSNHRNKDICNFINMSRNENNSIRNFFDVLEENLEFEHWFFGHYHFDKNLTNKHTVLYDDIIQITEE